MPEIVINVLWRAATRYRVGAALAPYGKRRDWATNWEAR
jgi:hypothetical protein